MRLKLFFLLVIFLTGIQLNTFGQSSLLLTEYMPENLLLKDSVTDKYLPWFEIQNTSMASVDLQDYTFVMKTGQHTFPLSIPPVILPAGQPYLFWISSNPVSQEIAFGTYLFLPDFQGDESIYLGLKSTGEWVDSLKITGGLQQNEIIGKLPFPGEMPFVYNANLASPNQVNILKPNWRKLNTINTFPAADSEPNACLNFRNKIWILGGWSLDSALGQYHSKAYVWNSDDGIHWQKVMEDLPFTHYSGFVVFKDSMRVYTNFNIYVSIDGIHWVSEYPGPYDFFGEKVRFSTRNDTLFFVEGDNCGYSTDGLHFTVSKHNIPVRNYGSLQSLNDKLYFFGGFSTSGNNSIYYNDVWSSLDGLHWDLVVSEAAWLPRKWFMSEVYDNKLWILGGYNGENVANGTFANINDIWYTENGWDWKPYTKLNPWPIRHASYHTVKDNKIWLMGGFDNNELNGLYNDVWTFDHSALFLKPGGPDQEPDGWGYSPFVGSPSTTHFSDDDILYYITTQTESLQLPDFGSKDQINLIIGNGIDSVTCRMSHPLDPRVRIIVANKAILHLIKDPDPLPLSPLKGSTICFDQYYDLIIPPKRYHNLQIQASTLKQLFPFSIENNLNLHNVTMPNSFFPVGIQVGGDISLQEVSSFSSLIIFGTGSRDQRIWSPNDKPLVIDYLTLVKNKGRFVLNGHFLVNHYLNVLSLENLSQ